MNIQQLIYGYTDVEITGTKDYVFKKYEALLSRVNQMNIRSYIYQLLPSKVIETSIILGVVMLICYGTIFIQNTKDLATFLAVFAIAAFRLLPSGNRMMIALMNLKGYSYTIDRLETLHKEENIEFEKSKNTVNKAKHIDFKDKIILENLSFTYTGSSSISLQNINLEINQGDHIGIIGKSGSGKSTLMKIFLGFLMPESGAFKVDDIMIDSNNMSAWRKKIGYVPQDIFISDATIKENIAFGIDPDKINIDKLNRSIKDASLEEFIGQLPLGINTALGEKGNLISGGQRQRIGIARALYHGAEVLFFDEATSALDNETEKVITESITALSKNKSITTLTIAHREKTLSFCNKIIEMSNGSIKQIKQHGKSI